MTEDNTLPANVVYSVRVHHVNRGQIGAPTKMYYDKFHHHYYHYDMTSRINSVVIIAY